MPRQIKNRLGSVKNSLRSCNSFLPADGPEWEELTLTVAGGALDREETALRLRKLLP